MPRPVFTSQAEFIKWLANAVNPTKYVCYATASRELIMVPTVSTRPIMYGHYCAVSGEDFNTAKKAVETMGIPVFVTGRFDWNTEDRVSVS